MSAEIPRSPWTISLIRRGGTLIALASAYCEMPNGLRNSSSRISPGCEGGTGRGERRVRFVVVCDRDLVRMVPTIPLASPRRTEDCQWDGIEQTASPLGIFVLL